MLKPLKSCGSPVLKSDFQFSLPSPVHEADHVYEVGVAGVRHDDRVIADILAEEGREDVEDVSMDIPLDPQGIDGAAEEGELGHVDGPTSVEQIVVDDAEVLHRRRRKYLGAD